MENGYLLTAIGVLASAVVAQWKIQYESFKRLEKKVSVCEQDRLDLWSKISELSNKQCKNPECFKYQHK